MNSNEKLNRPRRIWLRVVIGAAVATPLGMFVTQAAAVQNGPGRGALKYQDSPNAGKTAWVARSSCRAKRRKIVEDARSSPAIPRSPPMAGASCGNQRNNFVGNAR